MIAISRKCYIHPAVLEAFTKEDTYQLWTRESSAKATEEGLGPEENSLLRFLSAWAGPA